MTRVCLVGDDDLDLRFELLSRETARAALSTYDLVAPFENCLACDVVSIGAAVSLLNDLNWYVVRFCRDAMVLEPSITEEEWLSKDLATAVRDGEVAPDATDEHLKIYGVADGRLVEPMYVSRTGGSVPEYDLREVDETVPVRVTEDEFGRQN